MEQAKHLKAQNSELEAQEKELDNQKAWLEQNIKVLSHDPISRKYPLMLLKIKIEMSDCYFLWELMQISALKYYTCSVV